MLTVAGAAPLSQRGVLGGAPRRLNAAERELEAARARASYFAVLAAQAGQIEQARAALASLDQELPAIAQTANNGETPEEIVERPQITTTCQAIAAQRERQIIQVRNARQRIESAIA